MFLDEMTMKEFEERVNDKSVVILPIGAVEEHGAHLPLCTDSVQPEYVVQEVAKRTGAFIAPMIKYGVCSSTKNFPGTISLSFDTLRSLIYDVTSELVRNGFRNIVILTGHAGRLHMAALRLAAQKVVDEHPETKVMVLSDYDIAYNLKFEEIPEGDGHSGMIETSRVMAVRGGLVKGKGEEHFPDFPRFRVVKDPERYFPSGVMGDPTKASKEFGERMNNAIIDELEALIKEMVGE